MTRSPSLSVVDGLGGGGVAEEGCPGVVLAYGRAVDGTARVQAVLIDQSVAVVVPLGVGSVLIDESVEVIVDAVDRILVPQIIAVVVDAFDRILIDETVAIVVDDDFDGEGATPVELWLEGFAGDEDEAHRVQAPGVVGVADAPGLGMDLRRNQQDGDDGVRAGFAKGHAVTPVSDETEHQRLDHVHRLPVAK